LIATTKDLPIGAVSGPCYPDARVEIPDGWYLEVMPLLMGRGRVVVTNGLSITHFW